MHTDKISEMIAHFIGHFDTVLEQARGRLHPSAGDVIDDEPLKALGAINPAAKFSSDLLLEDYNPEVRYSSPHLHLVPARIHLPHGPDLDEFHAYGQWHSGHLYTRPHTSGIEVDYELPRHLPIHVGPGSAISHMVQVNLLQDDDFLNLVDDDRTTMDLHFVSERLNLYAGVAQAHSPFSGFERTDTVEGIQAIWSAVHSIASNIQSAQTSGNGAIAAPEGGSHHLQTAAPVMDGYFINGVRVDEIPKLEDLTPDRGIAAPAAEPEEVDTPLENNAPPTDTLVVAAGANVSANIAIVTSVGIMTPTISVMGDYHQLNVISQSYVYSDHDTLVHTSTDGVETALQGLGSTTSAFNIASFTHSTYGQTDGADTSAGESAADPVFPTSWRVSVIDGDVSFITWMEQFNFVTDNDQMKLTFTGTDTTANIGGNVVVNLANYLGVSLQYDLVIVGGHVYDMNIISQISVLYDNDWILGSDLNGAMTAQTGNNLIWNNASIHETGAANTPEPMPESMNEAVQAIENRDPDLPESLAGNANFQALQQLNVLYITGNLFDVTVIKQVNILGDADHVTQVARDALAASPDATISVDTGSNTVVNIASIMDYDSFGGSTYVAGQVFSDSVLIQSGLLDDDKTMPVLNQPGLANEVIAFLHDETEPAGNQDAIINGGHDLSWSLAHPADVMQTAVA